MIHRSTNQITWMIQSSTKRIARSATLIDDTSSIGVPRSSSFASTTSVVGSKNTLHRSVLPSWNNEDHHCPPNKKKVDFHGTVRVKRVSRRDRFSDQERSSLWYNSEEYMAIRQSLINTVTKMVEHKAVDMDPNDSTRGLEGKTPEQDALRQERRRIIMWSVLAEQLENELDDYETSSQAIAAVYSMCNQSCVFEAERRGQLDAIEAWGHEMPRM